VGGKTNNQDGGVVFFGVRISKIKVKLVRNLTFDRNVVIKNLNDVTLR